MTYDPFGLLDFDPALRENAQTEEMADQHIHAAQALATAAVQLDPKLRVTWFGDRAEARDGIIPGRWHLVRENDPPAPYSYFPITTPDGGYREPDSGVLFELQQRDLWRKRDPHPERKPQKGIDREALDEESAHEVRAALRVAGEGGMTGRKWGRG